MSDQAGGASASTPAAPGWAAPRFAARGAALHWGVHAVFWLFYFGFRTAAANAERLPTPPSLQEFPFLLNRALVVGAYAALSGLVLAACLSPLTRPWARLRPLILVAGAAALMPLTQMAEEALPAALWPIDPEMAAASTPFVTYAFQFGWALILWGAAQGLIAYHNRVLDQMDAISRERALSYDAQLKMLHYQINPHFLFNTLNAISSLVLDRKTEQAEGMLMRLSGFLRYSLDRDPGAATPLAGELAAQQKYLEIEQTRFGDKLAVDFDVEPGLERALVPSLLLQPILENAIKYAISPREAGGRIDIRVRREGELLRIRIDDDGPGAQGQRNGARRGVGLANVRERLSLLHGARAGLVAQNRPQGGFGVEIWLPYQEEKSLDRAVARAARG